MAKGDWWFKFEFNKWRNDSLLRQCSLETKGFWLEAICVMREMGTDRLKGSFADIARMVGCFPDESERCISELRRTRTADVTLSNDCVTLISRYIKKEAKKREQTKLRVRKLRGNAECNAPVTNRVISKSKELEKEKKEEGKKKPPDDLAKDLLILKTESVLNLKLLLDEKRLVAEGIPTQFTEDWGTHLKARTLKLGKDASRTALIQALGYAITDYRRDHKKDYEKLNRLEPKLPSVAEKIAEEERRRSEPKNDPTQFMCGMPAKGHLDSNAIRRN